MAYAEFTVDEMHVIKQMMQGAIVVLREDDKALARKLATWFGWHWIVVQYPTEPAVTELLLMRQGVNVTFNVIDRAERVHGLNTKEYLNIYAWYKVTS